MEHDLSWSVDGWFCRNCNEKWDHMPSNPWPCRKTGRTCVLCTEPIPREIYDCSRHCEYCLLLLYAPKKPFEFNMSKQENNNK